MKALIVAPLGDFERASSVSYLVEVPSDGFKETRFSEYCARLSTAALYSALTEDLGWSCECLFLVPSTLAIRSIYFYGEFPESFADLEKLALKYIEENLCRGDVFPEKYSVKVLPSIGSFVCPSGKSLVEVYFKGSMRVFYANVYLHVLKVLAKGDYDVVVLDLSHSVNFMPFATKSALEYASYAYMASSTDEKKRLYLLTYCAVPVICPRKEPLKSLVAPVHLLETIRLEPKSAFKILCDEIYRLIHYRDEGYRTFRKERLINITDKSRAKAILSEYKRALASSKIDVLLDDLWKLTGHLVDSIENGLVLKLATVLDKLSEDYVKALETIIVKYSTDPGALVKHVSTKDKSTVIEYEYAIEPRKRLIKLHALLYAVVSKKMKLGSISDDGWFSIDVLKKIKEEFIVDPVKEIIIDNELSDFKKRILGLFNLTDIPENPLASREGVPYAAVHALTSEARAVRLIDIFRKSRPFTRHLVKELEEKAEKVPVKYHERDFYAHAGLEQNIVQVKVSKGSIYLKYRVNILEEKQLL